MIVSLILGFALIGEALYWQPQSDNGGGDAADVNETADRSYTLEELTQYDGKVGNECLVAVDGAVYLIESFALWKDGEHLPSGGRARCGLDLTEMMDNEAPHGRSKLPLLKKIGLPNIRGLICLRSLKKPLSHTNVQLKAYKRALGALVPPDLPLGLDW
jgi:predicted heme/steroid binding protein